MRCPKCHEEMRVVEKTEATNLKVGKIYSKDSYLCEADDVWIIVEAPQS